MNNSEQHPTKKRWPFIEAVLSSLGYEQQDATEANSDRGRQDAAEHNSDRTRSLALAWLIVGLITVSFPYIISSTQPIIISLSSVLGSLIISSAGIATLNNLHLRRSQMKETQEVMTEKLSKFQKEIEDVFINRISWAKAIEAAEVKDITNGINVEKIRNRIKNARGEHIKLLFISYATIGQYWAEFREALNHGCNITILVGNPDTNSVINFYEACPQFHHRSEREFARICVKRVTAMQEDFSDYGQGKFRIVKFDMATSVVAIQIGSWAYFGIPWFHIESFDGPWFEIDGENGILARAVQGHIKGLLEFAHSNSTTSLAKQHYEEGKHNTTIPITALPAPQLPEPRPE